MGRVRHIIWDWNGTLLDDTPLTVKAATVSLAAINHPVRLTVDQWREVATRPVTRTYETLCGAPLDEAQFRILNQSWLSTYCSGEAEVGLNPTAVAALELARSAGVTQSILSLYLEPQLRARVTQLGVADHFTDIWGTRDGWKNLQATKADRMLAQLAAVGVSPDEALVIGDMVDDGDEAVSIGASATLVSTGDTSHQRLAASGFPVASTLVAAVRPALLTN
ncbi:MAG: HAD hydrolase-like protein [Propionibacteriaceae bacterium]|jgi:phosphoglycolate phosphatase-like HAD superfamily hydrolase|nr:HAD hydrolase-like protein [Propionibacteriaceae bacterium]